MSVDATTEAVMQASSNHLRRQSMPNVASAGGGANGNNVIVNPLEELGRAWRAIVLGTGQENPLANIETVGDFLKQITGCRD